MRSPGSHATWPRSISACGLAGLLAGCGGDGAGAGGAGAGGEAAATSGPASTGSFETTSSGAHDDGCAESARFVYLLDKERELVRFDPETLSLEVVGLISCSVVGGPAVGIPTPFSMSVGRDGTAWVLYSDGSVHTVDVTTAECRPTDFIPNQLPAFELFGMGFVTNGPDTRDETLFVASYSPGDGIGTLDLGDLGIRRQGFYDVLDGPAELTGTGDGHLYGFFFSNPPRVAEIDKVTADIKWQNQLPGVSIGQAWAFAHWGGDFWLFTAPEITTSKITRFRPSNGAIDVMVEDAGLLIVGAGVSTCAPLVPPK
jgi:hypothetical protein